MIHNDKNHTNSNNPLSDNSTNIWSIHDDDISVLEEILVAPVNLVHTPPPVPASPIFLSGRTSDPVPPSNESSAEIITPKGNPKPHNNPLNLVPNVQSDPDSDPN